MARPLKKLSEDRILLEISRLRGRNNRHWAMLWKEGLKTRRGRKAWMRICETDMLVNKWAKRL